MNEEIMQDVKEQLAGALDYDQAAKGVLSQKKVLAYILKRTVPEFESASLDDISKVKDQLINLLDLMFKSSKDASEKITTLHNDFGIDLTQEGEGDLAVMCNLGEGIYEDGLMKGKQEGWEKGREEGRREGKLEFALELLKDGMALEKVAKYSKLSLSIIKELAKQNKLI